MWPGPCPGVGRWKQLAAIKMQRTPPDDRICAYVWEKKLGLHFQLSIDGDITVEQAMILVSDLKTHMSANNLNVECEANC
jgi:hypothetical protein